MKAVDIFFHWPDGGIWSNLLASVIWGLLAYTWAHFKFKSIHRRIDQNDQLTIMTHKKVKQLHNHFNPDNPYRLGDNNGE